MSSILVAVHAPDDVSRRDMAAAFVAAGARVRRSRAQAELVKNLADGAVRVVVTTHAPLSIADWSSCPVVHVAPADTLPDVVARALRVATASA